jgi:hypothetical protein
MENRLKGLFMLAVFVGISGAILFYLTLPCGTSNYYTV